jgi:hypothetical protein
MRTKNFLQWTVVAGFILLSGWLFSTGCISSGKNYTTNNRNGANTPTAENKVWKIVKASDIKKAVSKSEAKKIILNVYPVKLSKDPGKNDFDLMIFFQDATGLINLGSKINNKTFVSQSTWYVSYLKSKNIPLNKIPYGYHIKIDSAFFHDFADFDICVIPEKAQIEYCLLPGTKNAAPLSKPDSTGKCPPDCCNLFDPLKIDSTGKCPPDCLPYSLLLEKTMKGVIVEVYK